MNIKTEDTSRPPGRTRASCLGLLLRARQGSEKLSAQSAPFTNRRPRRRRAWEFVDCCAGSPASRSGSPRLDHRRSVRCEMPGNHRLSLQRLKLGVAEMAGTHLRRSMPERAGRACCSSPRGSRRRGRRSGCRALAKQEVEGWLDRHRDRRRSFGSSSRKRHRRGMFGQCSRRVSRGRWHWRGV